MVLEDHVKRGKKRIPPLLAMNPSPQQSQWLIERLPELFWLGFVASRLGNQETLELAGEMARGIESTIKRTRGTDKPFRAYLPTEHFSCTDYERQTIVAEHQDSRWFRRLIPLFATMTGVWAEFPFQYLVNTTQQPSAELTLTVKQILQESLNRHDRLALFMQATTVALEIQLNHLFFAKGLHIPDLNAIFDYPNTEESEHAAGFVVATSAQLVLFRNLSEEPRDVRWARAFWNGCYRLEGCEYA